MMNKILGLLVLSVLFVACGSDDKKDPVEPKTVIKAYSFKKEFDGIKNVKQTINAEILLSQVLPVENKGLISANFQLSDNHVLIGNYAQSHPNLELKDVTVTVGTRKFNLGTCKVGGMPTNNEFSPGIALSGNNEVEMIKAIFDAFTTSKEQKAYITLEFTSNESFVDAGIYLEIKINGQYVYYVLAN